MINKILVFSFLLILMGGRSILRAEPYPHQESGREETALSVLYNRVLVYQKEGDFRSGLLLGTQNNVLRIQVGTEDVRIPFTNLAKVVIKVDKNTSPYAVSGMLIGMYLGSYYLLRQSDQPGAYLDDDIKPGGILLWNLVCAGAGGGLGLLAGSLFAKKEEVFAFDGPQEKRLKEWERLKNFVLGVDTSYKRTHFSVQAGKVFFLVSNRYRDQFAGPQLYSNFDPFDSWRSTSFNLLRSLRATYSPKRWFEVGASVMWLGEPSLHKHIISYDDLAHEEQGLHVTYDATGYYLVGVFKPLSKTLPPNLSWELGLGLGAANIRFDLTAYRSGNSQNDPNAERQYYIEHHISDSVFSGVVFTALNLNLYRNLSLGVYADYAYLPDREVPGVPALGIGEQKLQFGNACIGFSLGLHF